MNVVKATRQFEDWLGQRTDIVKKDLHLKHANMKAAVFPFLRATYYRWAQMWPKVCPRRDAQLAAPDRNERVA